MLEQCTHDVAECGAENALLQSDPQAFKARALKLFQSPHHRQSMVGFEMLQQWRLATSRYRVFLSEWSACVKRTKGGKPKPGFVHTEVSRGWTLEEAKRESVRLNGTLSDQSFCSPSYSYELTNVWEVMPERVKAQALAEGKCALEFDR